MSVAQTGGGVPDIHCTGEIVVIILERRQAAGASMAADRFADEGQALAVEGGDIAAGTVGGARGGNHFPIQPR